MRGLWIAFAAVGTVLIAWLIMRPSVAEPRRPPSAPVTRPTPVPTLTVESRPTVAPVSGATPSPTAAPAVPGSIAGVVVTTDDKPVAGADVSALIEGEACATARCNEAGAFKLERLPLDRPIEIRAASAWHALGRARNYELSLKKPHLNIMVRMVEAGGVSGTVRDTAGRPVAGARIEFSGEEWHDQDNNAVADANGTYMLNGLAVGTYSAKAEAAGYCGERRDKLEIQAGRMATGVDFQLMSGVRVAGRVVTNIRNEERPEPGVSVQIVSNSEEKNGTIQFPGHADNPTTTGLDGRFVFNHVVEGLCVFRAQKDARWCNLDTTISTSMRQPVVMVLPAEGVLRGVIVGRSGLFVFGADIETQVAEYIAPLPKTTSGADGRFNVIGLNAKESYSLTVTADGYATTHTEPLLADPSIEHRIQLTAGCTLAGRVLMGDTGAPAPGVSLRVDADHIGDARQAVTNTLGEFRIERLTPGKHVIGGRRVGLGSTSLIVRPVKNVQIGEGEIKPVELKADQAASISGTVFDQDKQPVAKATLRFESALLPELEMPYSDEQEEEFGLSATAETDEDGNYSIAAIAPGDLSATAQKDGYESGNESPKTTTAKPGQKVEHFDFTLIDEDKNPLKQDVSIKGRVIGPDRRPIGGITVWLYHEEGEDDEKRFEKGKSTTTDAQGRFAFTQKRGLVSGVVVLPTRALPCFGLAPVSADITLRVQRCARASGLVTDTYAHRIEAATVRFEVTGSPAIDSLFSTEEYDVETDANGAFAIDLLPPLECRIFAYKDGYESHEEGEATVTLAPGEEKTDLLLLLDPEGTFKGRLLDAQGRPLADWSVDGNSERDADGFFRYSLSEIRTLVDFEHEDKFESGLTRDVGYVTGSIDYPRRKPAEVTQWTIPATGSVSGRIVYADGTPAAHLHGALALSDEQTASAFEQCVLQSCTVDHPDLTGADGRFRLEAVPPGTFGLSFDGKAVASTKIQNVIVRPGRDTDLGTITVARGATARGRLIDAATRQPITSAKYRLEPEVTESDDSDAGIKLSDFDGDGWFTIDSISPTLGRVQLNVMKKNVYSGAWDYTGSVALPAHKAGEVMNLGDVALPAQKK